MWDYNHKSISTDQAKPMGDFVTVATTIGAIAAGVALFEVALIPGMAIGAAASPVRLRQDRRRLPPECRPSTRAEMVLSKPMLPAGLLGAGPAKVESSPAAMATDSRPAEKIPWIWSKIFI